MGRELLVRDYFEMRDFVEAFADGYYDLFALLGDTGTGKSETRRILEKKLGKRFGLLTGYHSELDLYKKLYQFRYYPIVLDDIDSLFEGSIRTSHLKAVCDTKPVKRIEWGSTHRAFDDGLPNVFESISRVMIVANELKTLTKNLGAILDRGMVIRFQPSAFNMHVDVASGGWFDDAEVFREIGKYLHLMVHPSFRFYGDTRNNKRAGLDWKAILLRQLEDDPDDRKLVLAAKIMNDSRYKAQKEQEEAFIKHPDGGSQATWFRKKRELKERRGDIDMAVVAQMNLLKYGSIDPYTQEQLDRRKELEAERDALEAKDKAAATRRFSATDNGNQIKGQVRTVVGGKNGRLPRYRS